MESPKSSINSELDNNYLTFDILPDTVLPVCKSCGTTDVSLFTPKRRNYCKICKKASNPKTFSCKSCGETESSKFSEGRYSTCKKCKSIKISTSQAKKKMELQTGMTLSTISQISEEINDTEGLKNLISEEIKSSNFFSSKDFFRSLNLYLQNDVSLLKICPIKQRLEELSVLQVNFEAFKEDQLKINESLKSEISNLKFEIKRIKDDIKISKVPDLRT